MDLTEEDEGLSQEEVHHPNVEGLQEEGPQSDQRHGTAGVGNQAGKTEKYEVRAHLCGVVKSTFLGIFW